MSCRKVRIGSFLKRRKDAIEIESSIEYRRITIKTKHQGIFLRDCLKGSLIGTKLQFKVRKGQFLLSKIDARLGAFSIVPESLDGAIITGNFWAFDVDKSQINIEWFNLFTSSGDFYEICNKASSGTTHRKYLDETKFFNFEIDLPKLNEQNDFIGKYKEYKKSFNSLDYEIENQQTYLQLLRQTILHEAVQGKLTKQDPTDEPANQLLRRIKAEKEKLIKAGKLKKEKELPPITEDEIPFELPQGWMWCRLADVKDINYSLSYGVLVPGPDLEVNGIPFVRLQDLDNPEEDKKPNKSISAEIEKKFKKTRLEGGEILIGVVGSIGKIAVAPKSWKGANIARAICRLVPDKHVDFSYLLLVLQNPITQKYFKDATRTLAQPTLNVGFLETTLIPLPPLAEQQRIVTKVQQLQQQLSQLQAQVQQSRQYDQQLLQSVLKEAFEQKRKVYEMKEKVGLNMVAEE
jgi:type I restriction enzyme, S subunit